MATQAVAIQIMMVLVLVLFLVCFVVYDSIPKVQLAYRLTVQRRNIKRLQRCGGLLLPSPQLASWPSCRGLGTAD